MGKLSFIAIVFGWMLALSFSAPRGRTWYVKPDGTGDAPTVQAAVDSAVAGDSIYVAAGKYFDARDILVDGVTKRVNLHLYKNVKVIGESGPEKTMIKGYESDIGVYIENVDSTAELRNFIIETSWENYTCIDTGSTVPEHLHVGIECRQADATVTENLVHFNDIGVKLTDSAALVMHNEIHHSLINVLCRNGSNAVLSDNEIHDGMRLIHCDASSPLIEANELRRACEGIRAVGDANPLIINNTIHFTFNWAVVCRSGSVIDHNRIEDNASAVRLENSISSVIVRNNVFYHNVIAIEVSSSADALIEKNTIDACEFGIYCDNGSGLIIQNNIISRPNFGIFCEATCSLIIACNDIFGARVEPYSGTCPDLTGSDGNISLDPEFCGIFGTGNYNLQSDSPCASGNHPDGYNCDRIGAFEVGCGQVPTKRMSIGKLKSLFNKKDRRTE